MNNITFVIATLRYCQFSATFHTRTQFTKENEILRINRYNEDGNACVKITAYSNGALKVLCLQIEILEENPLHHRSCKEYWNRTWAAEA
jgi:hypothetical protein